MFVVVLSLTKLVFLLIRYSELLGIIFFVMLFVSVCYILLVRYDSALTMFVVILLLGKLVFLLMRCSEGVGGGRVLVVC